MKVATPKQMNEIDSLTINQVGIPGMVLMENAALKVVEEIVKSMGDVRKKNIYIFAGKGNNGGDAFAAARHLYNMGAKVEVYVTAPKASITGDAGANLKVLENMGMQVIELLEQPQMETVGLRLAAADMIVDGIFGTGFRGEVTGLIRELIELINNSAKEVIAIDIPSGVNGETGEVAGTCIKASSTVTFAVPKQGIVVHPGCEFTGKLVVAHISIPESVIKSLDIRLNLTDRSFAAHALPKRPQVSNKGSYGKLLIITGSTGMTGAGSLTAGAALRAGAGLVYMGVPSSLADIYDTLMIESITLPLEDNETGRLGTACIPAILGHLKGMSAVAVGPGLSGGEETVEVVSSIIENSEIPLVLDADGLNAVAKDISMLKKLKAPAVVTPHPGEMARLMGVGVQEVQRDRIGCAREFAGKWGVVTVLKGARTVTASPDGTVHINPTGNPGMATGGTGDVLTGIIAALIGQGVKPYEAAAAGVYLHGLAGDRAAHSKGLHGLIARDLVDELPYAIKAVVEG